MQKFYRALRKLRLLMSLIILIGTAGSQQKGDEVKLAVTKLRLQNHLHSKWSLLRTGRKDTKRILDTKQILNGSLKLPAQYNVE